MQPALLHTVIGCPRFWFFHHPLELSPCLCCQKLVSGMPNFQLAGRRKNLEDCNVLRPSLQNVTQCIFLYSFSKSLLPWPHQAIRGVGNLARRLLLNCSFDNYVSLSPNEPEAKQGLESRSSNSQARITTLSSASSDMFQVPLESQGYCQMRIENIASPILYKIFVSCICNLVFFMYGLTFEYGYFF